jgi:hypothetical protein
VTCAGPDCTRPAQHAGLCAPHRRQQLRGRDLTPLRLRGLPADQCIVCQDVDEVLRGIPIEVAAPRVRMTPASLERHLRRHERPDLLAAMPRLAEITPTPYR